MDRISGFLVVRKPEFNYDKEGRGAFSPSVPKIGDLYYAGIDRMPWFDIDEDYYSKELPDDILLLRNELENNKWDFTDFKLMPDLEKANKLLEYSNKKQRINELIAVYSEKIGLIEDIDFFKVDTEWLGVDIYCHGYGSLIREGIFTKPDLFADYSGKLNTYGLFNSDIVSINQYIDLYIECSAENDIEPIDGAKEYLDKIAISRLFN